MKLLLFTFLAFFYYPHVSHTQNFNALFDNAIFKKKFDLGISGSVCIVSSAGDPIAVMWRWWGQNIKLHLKPQQLASIFGQLINPPDIKVLDRWGRLVGTGSKHGVTVNLGTDPRYLITNKNYHPPPGFADYLNEVKVKVFIDIDGNLKVSFRYLTKNATIEILTESGKMIKALKNFRKPEMQWDCTNNFGIKVNPGVYRYQIHDKGERWWVS